MVLDGDAVVIRELSQAEVRGFVLHRRPLPIVCLGRSARPLLTHRKGYLKYGRSDQRPGSRYTKFPKGYRRSRKGYVKTSTKSASTACRRGPRCCRRELTRRCLRPNK